jgi:protoporphyrinogen/coproporphyrinogen III oxidase
MPTVHVIGAGLSGLAAAWYLADAGAEVHVIEAGPRPGGLIQTRHPPEGLVETAARAFTWSDRTGELFATLGVETRFAQPQSKRRYVFRNGRPRRWPLTPVETAGAAVRAGRAWVGRSMRPRRDESVAAWGTRVLGRSATTWLVAPVLQGIYASPPDALSAFAIFGRKRAFGGRMVAPPAGMGELIDRLHDALRSRGVTFTFNSAVDRLDRAMPAVVCTNAPAAARLLEPHAPSLAAALKRIRMVSLVTATAFFAPREDDLRGFGVLFPRSAGIEALGVLFNTDIFAGRGALRSETWIYGSLSAAALPTTEDAVRARIVADRAVLTGRRDEPSACYVTPQLDALPVYDAAVVEAGAASAALPSTLALAGNYLGRLGVSNLLDGAAEAAARLQPKAVAA